MVLEKTLESPLDCKEIQPVHCKGNQSWIFIGRTDAEAETPILWPPDAKNRLTGKDPDVGKDWRWEIVGWHHQHDGLEFEQAPGVADGQGSLVCYSPWGHKELDTTKQLNWTEQTLNQKSAWLWEISNSQGWRWGRDPAETSENLHQFSSVAQSRPTLWDPMNHSTPGHPVHHQLLEFTQTHVHRVGDAIFGFKEWKIYI